MIEDQSPQTSQFFATTGTAGTAMQRHGHHVAMPGMAGLHGRRHQMDAALRVSEFQCDQAEVCIVVRIN